MKRIDTATRAIDLFGAGKDGFKDGNLALAIAATDLDAEWFNDVQEELSNVIEAGGVALAANARNQLLLALRAAGVFTTPAQFDNTTKAATSAFVKRHGLQASDLVIVTVTGSLSAAHAGSTVAVNAAGATTQTLPAANAVQIGAQIELFNINTGIATVSRAGADTLRVNNGTVTSLALGAGDTLRVQSNGVDSWHVIGGSLKLGSAATFAFLGAGVGYQRFPTGMIVQWGTATVAPGGLATSMPIAFPTAVYVALGTHLGTDTSVNVVVNPSTTAISLFHNNAGSVNIAWIAIGR